MTKRIGFTGTRDGMTEGQKAALRRTLEREFEEGAWFHHGDCVGADEQAHDIALGLGYFIAVHPPSRADRRAFKAGHQMYKPRPYLSRNADIVEMSHLVIAAVKGPERSQPRSGTWSTVRHAIRRERMVRILEPNGDTSTRGGSSGE